MRCLLGQNDDYFVNELFSLRYFLVELRIFRSDTMTEDEKIISAVRMTKFKMKYSQQNEKLQFKEFLSERL